MRLLLALVLLLDVGSSGAEPVNSGHVRAELVAESASVQAGATATIGLSLEMDRGWHTYWRNPGDSGAPTTLEWTLPEGVTVGDFHWPVPERIVYGPLINLGYHGRIVLPMELTVPAALEGKELALTAKGTWLVCADVCIPESAELKLNLPVAAEPPNRINGDLFVRAWQAVPRDIGVVGNVASSGDNLRLNLDIGGLSQDRIEKLYFLPFGEGLIELPPAQPVQIEPDQISLTLVPGYDYQPDANLSGILVVEEVEGGAPRTAFEVNLTDGSRTAPSANGSSDIGLLTAMLFAFLGGMILNLMPCVFPVLSIKILSLVEGAQGHASHLRLHGWVYTAGVVISFLAIALLLVVLRTAGAQIGWGFQLQSPIVVGLLFYLFVLIGLNLAGWFEIGTSMMGKGGELADRGGYSGSFFTGVLAAVVAAPCTAPFMGAAIGFALSRSIPEILATFFALGFGMAVPYLALCFAPALLKRLPRPGPWMVSMKEFLAYPMFASAVWLLWVLNQQTGADGLLAVTAGLVLLAFAIWLWKQGALVPKLLAGASVLLAIFLTQVVGQTYVVAGVDSPAEKSDLVVNPSKPYSPASLTDAVKQGPVFVNFTAAWCITCKVNDIAVLNTEKTKALFAARDVTYLKGDWTNEDPMITAALEKYGRSGVPLYLLYGKNSERAEVLPQILTDSLVSDAVMALAE